MFRAKTLPDPTPANQLDFSLDRAIFFLVGVGNFNTVDVQSRNDQKLGNRPFVLNGLGAMQTTLRKLYPEAKPEQFIVMRDPENKDQVLSELERIDRHTDFLFFYYSGHGEKPPEDNLLRLTTSDCTFRTVGRRGIKLVDLFKILDRIKGTKLVVLDCCFSGKLEGFQLDGMGQSCILTSTSSSQAARRGRSMPIFTEHLVQQLQKPNKNVKTLKEVLQSVPQPLWQSDNFLQTWNILDKNDTANLRLFPADAEDNQLSQVRKQPERGELQRLLPASILAEVQGEHFLCEITPDSKRPSFIDQSDEQWPTDMRLAAYRLSRTPVPFAWFDQFCQTTRRRLLSDQGWGRDRRPAINVSWIEALEFCNWLSIINNLDPVYIIANTKVSWNMEGKGFRLPTEAEWLNAAITPDQDKKFSLRSLGDYAWYRRNAKGTTHPVNAKKANAFGLSDLLGNVFEWCWNPYLSPRDTSYWSNERERNQKTTAVLKGGAYYSNEQQCSAKARSWDSIELGKMGYGLRIAQNI